MTTKIQMTRDEILEQAMHHFFLAMLEGWVGDGVVVNAPGKPWQDETIYSDNEFSVVDRYHSNPHASSGVTIISFQNKQIWTMTYTGHYRPEDIPPLKRILRGAYERGEFIGGRGPTRCPLYGCLGTYTNEVALGSSFAHFSGREEISDQLGLRGHHDYWGRAFI